jgi:hypothetical protein
MEYAATIGAVEADDLFLDTLEDLRRRCDLRASEYDMVQVAGLVRRLLFDGLPLWVEANKTHRVKPVYEWSRLRVSVGGIDGQHSAWVSMQWLDPMLNDLLLRKRLPPDEETAEFPAPRTGNINNFSQYEVIVKDGEGVTVSELVTHYANREGGVHYDSKPPKSQILSSLLRGQDLALRLTVLAIGRIAHRALEPLAARIALSRNPHPYGIGDDFVMNVVRQDDEANGRD